MADLSNVPPEVMQILTHDPPYSEGEKAILQNYVSQPDANPVMVRALQNLGVTESPYTPPPPQSRDLGIPGLDLPNNLDGLSGLSGLNPMGSGIEEEKANPRADAYDTIPFPQVLDRPNPGRQSDHQITADWAAPIGEAFDNGGGGLFTPGPPPSSRGRGSVNIPAWDPFSTDGGADTGTAAAITNAGMSSGKRLDPSALDAVYTAHDGTPSGSNTQTQGAPGTTDWKAERGAIDIPYDPLMINPESAFASVADSQLARVAANPEFMADVLYPGAPNMQANQTEWLSNVKMLAELGLLSNIPNADIFAGRPEGNVMLLEQVEALKNSMAGKGSEVDPRAIYQKAFARILNSDSSKFKAEDYGQGVAGDAENQIAVTNGMLGAVAPFVYSGSREAYIQRLNQAGMQYLSEVAMSGTSLSYPEWLKAHGADTWMS